MQGTLGVPSLKHVLSFLAVYRADIQGNELRASDPRCPPASCCGAARASTDCKWHVFWTESYCCPDAARSSACYRWGEDAPGHDLVTHSAASGAHCRHLCQSHEDCALWAYLVDAPSLPDSLRAQCFLKGVGAQEARLQAHPYVVSGDRICSGFREGLTNEEAGMRVGLDAGLPWRTHAGLPQSAFGWQEQLLPSAGRDNWHKEAAAAFNAMGFVVILDAIDRAQVAQLKNNAMTVAQHMLPFDPHHIGNRGPRRYSYGGASRTLHMMHEPEWARLLDIDKVDRVLSEIYPKGYLAAGGGGDFVLGATNTFQNLHLDIGGPVYSLGVVPAVGVNYIVDDLTCTDGPLRMLPGSHLYQDDPPGLREEPNASKAAVLCPLPAGAAIVRDLRTWHGGTPNGAQRIRYMPNAEFVSFEWAQLSCGSGEILDPCQPVLPFPLHQKMSEKGRAVTQGIVDRTGELEEAAKQGNVMLDSFAHCERHRADLY